ncbi:glycosyltransferase family 2 protein [Roseovarius rhodophyticola]|uniref:Glycosyltransferase family 2 protein n=1 Tax=Roseovarius rhodophyticola TaxID=3080827 RepID=A0ABZ2TGE9_9RHOB|nr:glycosyltransferase family 2 protein [Roseovarius sp. W115]MDV2929077.1 glycosyltransferase family 2 protein [Roseovarius sp. W115]
MAGTPNSTWVTDTELESSAIDPTDILVVLPALNEADHIETCLHSLMRPAHWMAQCRVVVADGGSTDGTQGIVERLKETYPNLHLLDNPGRLQSAGINAAVAQLSQPHHRLLVRCDVHAIYPAGYVQALAREHARVQAASVVTAMDATGQDGFQKAAAWIVDTPLGSGGSAHRGGQKAQFVDHGHHAAFDIDWFRRIGGYDPAISHNEDAEFDVRLAQSGGRIWLTDKTRISYVMRPTLLAVWQQYWNYGRGRANTLLKHRARPRLRQLIPVLNSLLLIGSALAIPFTSLALMWPALYASVLISTSLVAAMLLRSRDGLWSGPALGAMHMAWGLGFLKRIMSPAPARNVQSQTG